jgi:hypothetical protein
MDPLSLKLLLLLFAVLFGGIVALSSVDYIVKRFGGCLPGRMSCK